MSNLLVGPGVLGQLWVAFIFLSFVHFARDILVHVYTLYTLHVHLYHVYDIGNNPCWRF